MKELFCFIFAIFCCFTVRAKVETNVSEAEQLSAINYFLAHGKVDDLRRYGDHHTDPRWQAMLSYILASTLLDGNSQLQTAKKLMLQSLAIKPALTRITKQDAYIRLGILEEKLHELDQAKFSYQQAMEHGSAIACNYLGVLFEHQQNYVQARGIYESCIPEHVTPLLLMNLGTLYYNGLGVEQDHTKGVYFWQKSFANFPYDPDVNYNLGIYYQQISHNFHQARYHFALAAQLSDKAAKEKLKSSDIVNENTSELFSSELLTKDDESFNRLLNDRIFYLSGQTRIDGEADSDGVIIGHCEGKVGLCVTGGLTNKNINKYIDLALRIYFVDERLLMNGNQINEFIKMKNTIKIFNAKVHLSFSELGFYSFMIEPVLT